MLDILSGGRAVFGMGRGLSRIEYAPFRIPMSESRARFDEAAAMIAAALETGWIEGDGPYYPQPRVQLRPGPRGSFRDRLYCVAMSPDSIASVVAPRAGLMSIPTRPVPDLIPVYESYRAQYRAAHGVAAPAISLNVNMYCHQDAGVAPERSRQATHKFFASNVRHYEMAGEHFATTGGYERYAETAALLRQVGLEAAASVALFGTPDQIMRQVTGIRDVLGDFQLIVIPSFGGAASGIGRAMVARFAAEGMACVLADVEESALGLAVSELRDSGATAVGVRTDVSSAADVQAPADRALAEFGAVHVLCNNARAGGGTDFAKIPLDVWEWVLGVNLWGVIHGCRVFLPLLLEQDEGHIVNTSSMAALNGHPLGLAPYTVSKFGVLGLSQNLFFELAATTPGHVGVSVLIPGLDPDPHLRKRPQQAGDADRGAAEQLRPQLGGRHLAGVGGRDAAGAGRGRGDRRDPRLAVLCLAVPGRGARHGRAAASLDAGERAAGAGARRCAHGRQAPGQRAGFLA